MVHEKGWDKKEESGLDEDIARGVTKNYCPEGLGCLEEKAFLDSAVAAKRESIFCGWNDKGKGVGGLESVAEIFGREQDRA